MLSFKLLLSTPWPTMDIICLHNIPAYYAPYIYIYIYIYMQTWIFEVVEISRDLNIKVFADN